MTRPLGRRDFLKVSAAVTTAVVTGSGLAAEVKKSGRQTMGVRLMNLAAGDSLVAIARNAESAGADVNGDEVGDEPAVESPEGPGDRDGGEPEATE